MKIGKTTVKKLPCYPWENAEVDVYSGENGQMYICFSPEQIGQPERAFAIHPDFKGGTYKAALFEEGEVKSEISLLGLDSHEEIRAFCAARNIRFKAGVRWDEEVSLVEEGWKSVESPAWWDDISAGGWMVKEK